MAHTSEWCEAQAMAYTSTPRSAGQSGVFGASPHACEHTLGQPHIARPRHRASHPPRKTSGACLMEHVTLALVPPPYSLAQAPPSSVAVASFSSLARAPSRRARRPLFSTPLLSRSSPPLLSRSSASLLSLSCPASLPPRFSLPPLSLTVSSHFIHKHVCKEVWW